MQLQDQQAVSTEIEDKTADPPVFNFDDTSSRYDNDLVVVRMIIESFVEQTPGTIKKIESAIGSANSILAGSRSHALKGGASYIGAERVRDIAFEIESAGKSGDLSKAASLLPKLQSEFELFQSMIKGFKWNI